MASPTMEERGMASIEMTSMETRQPHSSRKEAMKKLLEFSGDSDDLDIDEWLFDLTNLFSVMKLKDETKNYLSTSCSADNIIDEILFDQQQALITFAQDPEHGQKIKNHLRKLAQEARENILKSQQQYKTRYGLNRQDLSLKINDLVLIKTMNRSNKFDVRYEGPFKVIKQIGRKTFIVQHVKKLTLSRQVTTDVMIPLVERWNLDK